MRKIKLLSEEVIAAISAGEVVERPLSVVKELVENSIDANADRIEINIENGGKSFIQVKDNGDGMSEEDLKVCLMKHATSKITNKEDLFNIKTMGFRGEALYSISQVSQLTITTRKKDSQTGYRLLSKGGAIISILEQGTSIGTTIEVYDLFFNMPVRKKFLKSENWEKSLILEFVQQIAILNPNISFILKSDRKDLLVLNKCGSKMDRIKQIFPDLADKLMYHSLRQKSYHGYAYISLPDLEIQNFNLFSVNNRPVKDKLFFKAINDYFSGQRKKSPFIYIDLHLPEDEVDVNVHPAKKEVKFRDNNAVYSFIRTLFDGLSLIENKNTEQLQAVKPFTDSQKVFGGEPSENIALFDNFVNESTSVYEPEKQTFRIIGSFARGFILLEKDNKLIVIDQHAAHERLIFNKLMAEYEKSSVTSQMIIPYVFTTYYGMSEILNEIKETLEKLGFIYQQVAPDSFALTGLPKHISFDTGVNTFLEIIENRECLKQPRDLVYTTFSKLACKEAVKKTDQLSNEEIQFLLKEIYSNNQLPFCPHGRNYCIEITLEELEKRFGRKD